MRVNGITRRLGSIALLALLALVATGCSSEGDDVMRSDESWDARGALLAWDGEVWVVDDQPIVVPASLGVDDQRVLGATVEASGTVDASGRRMTEAIDISEGEWPDSSVPGETIDGTIDQVDDSAGIWTVGDNTVVVPSGVRVHDASDMSAFTVGSSVTISGHRLDDDRIVALDIALSDEPSPGDESHDGESDAPFDPAVFTTPPTDEHTTDPEVNDDNDEKPEDRRKKEKEKEKDRD